MKRYLIVLLFVLLTLPVRAQEFFPSTEPASTLPKGVLARRFTAQAYMKEGLVRHYQALRIMYGFRSNLTFVVSATGSNHHFKKLPNDLTNYFLNHHRAGARYSYPYLFEGGNLYAKFRFFNRDGKNKHLRMALYGEVAKSFTAHDEAEPYLLADNSGLAGGLIITKLYKRLALSGTAGYIYPFAYKEKARDLYLRSGNAYIVDLSIGYLLYPKEYLSYKDININVYLEILGKKYNNATVTEKSIAFDISQINSMRGGAYAEVRPGLQLILNSTSRFDASIAMPLQGITFLHSFPLIQLNFQKYFFR